MKRDVVKELLPIISAYADGKTIQYLSTNGEWNDCDEPSFFENLKYRIKPEPKYRPFKDMKECWQEMLKHQPFGWVNDLTENNSFHNIIKIYDENGNVYIETELCAKTLSESFEHYAFIDGTPFGIEEDV